MAITVEALYEDGVFKPTQPLPLQEHERVRVTIHATNNWVQDTAGMILWTGDHETLRRLAEDVEFDPQEGRMIFADFLAGDAVFLDANSLVYHFTRDPIYGLACSHLLQRIENQEVQGLTSTHVLTEMAHRLMTIEAIGAFGWPIAGIAQRLRHHPAQVQQLAAFRQAVERVLQSQIQTLTMPPTLVAAATTVAQQTGLLSNDALIVAVMQAHGLTNLATNDADFDRVPGLTRYAPV